LPYTSAFESKGTTPKASTPLDTRFLGCHLRTMDPEIEGYFLMIVNLIAGIHSGGCFAEGPTCPPSVHAVDLVDILIGGRSSCHPKL
jgi:hypothetical protein